MRECESVWLTEECPARAVCAPSAGGTSKRACSCELHIDMASNGADGLCHPSSSTHVYWGVLVAITVASGLLALRALIRTRNTFRHRELKGDTLIVTCIASEIAILLLTFHTAIRATIAMSSDEEFVRSFGVVVVDGLSLMAFAFLSLTALLFFVLTVVRLLVLSAQATSIETSRARDGFGRTAKLTAVIGGSLALAGIAPLYVLSQYALLRVYISCWVLSVMYAVSRIPVKVAQLCIDHTSRRMVSGRIMTVFKECSHHLLIASVIFQIGSLGYVVCWFLGTHLENRYLLGHGCAFTNMVEFAGMLCMITAVNHHLVRLIRLRPARGNDRSQWGFDSICRSVTRRLLTSKTTRAPQKMANASLAVTPRHLGASERTMGEGMVWEEEEEAPSDNGGAETSQRFGRTRNSVVPELDEWEASPNVPLPFGAATTGAMMRRARARAVEASPLIIMRSRTDGACDEE